MSKSLKINNALTFSYPHVIAKPKKKPPNHESKLQQECVRWFRYRFPGVVIFSIPNGGSRHQKEVAKIKAEGVLAGVSDLFVMKSSRGFHGLFIEMKYGKNTTTKKQEEFMQKARAEKFATAVCYSYDEFVTVTTQYLNQKL